MCSDRISQFLPCAHCLLSLSTTEKSLALHSLLQPIRYLNTWVRHPPEALFSRLSSLSSFRLSSYGRCSSPLVIFVVLHWTWSSKSFSFLYWGTRSWTQCSMCGFISAKQRQKTTSLHMLSIPFLMWPRRLLAALAIRLHHCLMVSLLFTKTLKPFSAGLFFSQSGHSM